MAGYGVQQVAAILLAYLAGVAATVFAFAVAMHLPELADAVRALEAWAARGGRRLWGGLQEWWCSLDD